MAFLQAEEFEPALTLNLVLTAKWFDQVESGQKDTEYREVSPYWKKRIWDKRFLIEKVGFSRGYKEVSIIRPVVKIDKGPCPYDGWDGDYYRIHFTPLPTQIQPTSAAPGASPILVSKKFITLQGEEIDADEYLKNYQRPLDAPDDVMILGCKGSCSSVWCSECYTRKGGSRRVAEQLSLFDFRRTRQLVLTCDPKKFQGPQQAFEYLRDKKSIAQFIHNMKRTSNVKIGKWLWVLEWHENGYPHWHLFVEVDKAGKAGMIGNEKILKHWKYGIIHESYIRNERHWKQFTTYFGKAGYFDPKQKSGDRKSHQRELPEWAMNVTYRIRKMSSSIPRDAPDQDEMIEEKEEPFEKVERNTPKKTYAEILGGCGESTLCQIWYDDKHTFWKKLMIPYKEFINICGEYVHGMGYQIQMKFNEWMLFTALFDTDSEEAIAAA